MEYFIVALIFVLVILFFVPRHSKVIIKTNPPVTFQVELAKSSEEIATGLMNHTSLETNKGMLFIYEKAQKPGFWMKHMDFPIDILFIDKEGVIRDIKKDFQPCPKTFDGPFASSACPSYAPKEPIKLVLEISNGLSEKYNIQVGDKAIWKKGLLDFFF